MGLCPPTPVTYDVLNQILKGTAECQQTEKPGIRHATKISYSQRIVSDFPSQVISFLFPYKRKTVFLVTGCWWQQYFLT